MPPADHCRATCWWCAPFCVKGFCEHLYVAMHIAGIYDFAAFAQRSKRKRSRHAPVAESTGEDSGQDSGPMCDSVYSKPGGNDGLTDREIARSMRSHEFFEWVAKEGHTGCPLAMRVKYVALNRITGMAPSAIYRPHQPHPPHANSYMCVCEEGSHCQWQMCHFVGVTQTPPG